MLRLVGSSIGGHYASNWYVGQSVDVPCRLQAYWTGQGCKWNQLYRKRHVNAEETCSQDSTMALGGFLDPGRSIPTTR